MLKSQDIYVKARSKDLYNFDRFTDIQRRIINEVGCTACTSGVNLRFDIERFFTTVKDSRIKAINQKQFGNNAEVVTVVAPQSVADNFKSNVAARRAVLKELGHPACTSGYNIVFESRLGFAVNESAEIVRFG